MRRVLSAVAVACAGVVAIPAAQDPPAEQETFRTGVDVIQIDVTVLDEDRVPVHGLTAEDFTVKEDGEVQRIVAVAEIDAAESDPAPSAWMRYAPNDVASNDLADGLGDGQAVAIVLDDFSIPEDSVEIAVATREVARYIVDSLGPSDQAAVVFPFKPGRTQDFTSDRAKLLEAIDRFDPEQPEFRRLQPRFPSAFAGDVQRYSPVVGRDPCLQLQPVIPTLRTVTARLATVPNRRKALFFVSVGLPFDFRPGGSRCQGLLYDEMRRALEAAQRFNVNIHSVDPAGEAGYQRYLQQPRVRNSRMVPARGIMSARNAARSRHDFLEILGEETGGRPVLSDDLLGTVAEVLNEYSTYYLIGYETTHGEPDGEYRSLDVEVLGRDVEVVTRSGRWAPDADSVLADGQPTGFCWFDCWQQAPAASDVHLTGLTPHQPLKVRAAVIPLGRATAPGAAPDAVEVAAVLTVRYPPALREAEETLTLVRTVYSDTGRGLPPVQEAFERTVQPVAGDETQYDVHSRFTLEPGRREVRFNATSRLAEVSGSVFAEVVVPDLANTRTAASPIVLGTAPAGDRDDAGAALPVVPTTARDFTRNDRVTAWVRLFVGEDADAGSVEISARVLDADDAVAAEIPASTIPAEAFAADGQADYVVELPLPALDAGLHLLSLTATFEQARIVRRDLVFRVR